MKSLIIYASPHHGNTKKVVERMAKKIGARTLDILAEGQEACQAPTVS